MGKPQRKVKNLVALRKADQSRGINIKLRMEASVEADNDKTTNEGEQIDKWNWNLLLSQWLGQRLEAGWRSIDVVPLSYTDKRTELKMRAPSGSTHSVFSANSSVVVLGSYLMYDAYCKAYSFNTML